MSEIEGRRIYCSGRDLHTISAVSRRFSIENEKNCFVFSSQDVFQYPDISYLELSPTREASLDFKLAELPRAIGRLTELRFLILDTNHLHTLPNEIGHLRKLSVLVVSNNSLNTLPETMGNMESLESLHVTNNRLRELPNSFLQLRNLTFLDLSSNRLRQLPDGIGQMVQLRSLLLFENRLRTIPESLVNLKNLKTLWLGHNRLREIPRRLTQLKQLDWRRNYLSSILDGNPLVNPPIAVCRLGFSAIDQWFEKCEKVENLDLNDLQECFDGRSSFDDDTTSRYNTTRRTPHF